MFVASITGGQMELSERATGSLQRKQQKLANESVKTDWWSFICLGICMLCLKHYVIHP